MKYRVEGAINARWIITLPEFVESNCESSVESSPVLSFCEHCIKFTNYQCHLQTIEACLGRL
jgi:hypothetical protein